MTMHPAQNTLSHASEWTILCDFDGTISTLDTTDTLGSHFGKAGWDALETLWENGDIGGKTCMAEQIKLLDMDKAELDACLAGITIDPAFADFVAYAQAQQLPLIIVSDGLDYAIHTILAQNGLPQLPVLANQLTQTGPRNWALAFPNQQIDCDVQSGTCKCAVAKQQTQGKYLMIGDGRSDFCVSRRANFVFAKDSLINECERHQVAYANMPDFSHAPALLRALMTLND